MNERDEGNKRRVYSGEIEKRGGEIIIEIEVYMKRRK